MRTKLIFLIALIALVGCGTSMADNERRGFIQGYVNALADEPDIEVVGVTDKYVTVRAVDVRDRIRVGNMESEVDDFVKYSTMALVERGVKPGQEAWAILTLEDGYRLKGVACARSGNFIVHFLGRE